MSPTRSQYKELGLDLVSLEEKSYRKPKRPLMVGENKYDMTRDPFKLLIKESLMQQRNKMMDSFVQILQGLPTGGAYSSSAGVAPFKVQINFNIPIFEGHIDADVVDKWLNLLEGYFFVHNFSNREKLLLHSSKLFPMSKIGGKLSMTKRKQRNPHYLQSQPPGNPLGMLLRNNTFGSYDDLYTKWTTLWQERDQVVPDFTNIFHTLHTNLGIKDSEKNLVLKYHGTLHRYIQTKKEFLYISSLETTYRYAVKIEKKLKQKM
jgi:hypothetical protein